ncbi:helix-turn-helix domain-containing protein [Kitasatospora sp. NPDC058218]|uniref:helix-turn-helix domain-containing protein n=1 Tax=Kitasatospora sp. NPDC058218 TaxID=3346385 RepID=UPI0036DAFD2A
MRTSRSSSIQQARKVLADRLRELRRQAGLTGHALAALCGWHKSKVSRIENAVTAPSEPDVRAWCRACDAEGQADDLAASLRSVEGMFVEWKRMERTGLKHAQEAVLPLFERTARFRCYQPGIVPGLLQTRAYTTAMLRATQKRRVAVDDVDAAVQVRMERQQLLHDPGRTFAFLIEEAVLLSGLAGPQVAADQLNHLVVVSSLASLSLGIVPHRRNRVSMQVEGFWIFDNTQVNVELVSGYLTITQPSEVSLYAGRFRDLAESAVYGAAARDLITRALDTLG